jgi:hypothetical protein
MWHHTLQLVGTNGSEKTTASIYSEQSSTRNMGSAVSSNMFVPIYGPTWCHISDDCNLHGHWQENIPHPNHYSVYINCCVPFLMGIYYYSNNFIIPAVRVYYVNLTQSEAWKMTRGIWGTSTQKKTLNLIFESQPYVLYYASYGFYVSHC